MSNFSQMLEPLRAWWENASAPTRAAAVGLCLLVVIGLIVAGSLAASPDYQPIFHGVSGKDASAIEAVLREKNIAMRFDDKDGTVSVPSRDESEATMSVEAAEILSKDTDIVGIESLDKIGMGTSTEVERERILAANDGELAHKLMKIDAVNSAAVTISPGNSSSLFGTDVAPTAAVILSLKPGETLSAEQVKGIVYLVAKSVTGLTSKNVTLTDQTGTPLWKDNGAGDNALGDGQPLDASAKYAETQRLKLQDLLDGTLGLHKAIVTVNAELDFDQTQTDSVQHTPAAGMRTGLPVSVRDKTESLAGAGAAGAVGGPAGVASNIGPTTYPGGASGAGGNYKSEDTVTNYDNDTTHTVVQKAPGGVRKLSVAALVDNSVPAGDIPKIQAIIGTAIGAAPGDTARLVTVQQMAFDTSAQKAEQTQMRSLASEQLWNNVARVAAVSIAGCVLLFLLTKSGRRPAAPQLAMAGEGANIGLLEGASDQELETILEERPLRIEDVLAEMPEVDAEQRPRRRRLRAPSIEEQQDLKLESIQDMIAGHPESVALLLKGWMAE